MFNKTSSGNNEGEGNKKISTRQALIIMRGRATKIIARDKLYTEKNL